MIALGCLASISLTGIELPEGPYETVAGFVLAALGELPTAGDTVKVPGYTITVTEMDGRRIARLRVTPAPRPALPPDAQAPPSAADAPPPPDVQAPPADVPAPQEAEPGTAAGAPAAKQN